MPEVLRMKPEEIDTNDKRGKLTASVIGCEEKGIIYAIAFAEAGFKVICTDADQTLLKRLEKGKISFSNRDIEIKLKSFLRKGQLSITSELKNVVSQSDIIIMTLTAKIDEKKNLDYSEVENSCKQVGMALRPGSLFIYGGTASLGFTDGVIKEALENTSGLRVGEDFGLVYNPNRFFFNQPLSSIEDQELKVAATDKTSLEAAANVMKNITRKDVKQISDVKTAEAALLFEIAKTDADLALANELAVLCESACIDYFETLKLVDYVPNLAPTFEIEENNRKETYFLIESAESLNVKLRLPVLARKINEDSIRHAINLTKDGLRSCGKTIRRAKVGILAAAKPTTTTFVKMLEKKGAKVSLYDSSLTKNEISNMPRVLKRSFKESVEGSDCLVILTVQHQLKRLNLKKLRAIMKMPATIVDLTGIIKPEKVEGAGFTYRGLGRGTEKK
jgi:UDP-N-acetyl-D-mannosaminuronic acid dehydrogenase